MKNLHIEPSITIKTERSLKCYLNEIARIEVINPNQEALLAKRMNLGDVKAKELLIRSNLRFVVSCAKKYQYLGLPLGDLINEGNIGLLMAASTFDETKGFKFISYAVWSIRQAMMMALSFNVRMIRLPMNMVRATADVRQIYMRLEQRLEREPTADEIAAELDFTLDAEALHFAFATKVESLDEMTGQENSCPLWSFLADESCRPSDQIVMQESMVTELNQMLSIVTDRERKILCAFFGIATSLPKSLDEIGAEMQLSGERIRQLKDQALKKIRKMVADRSGF